MKFDSDKEYDLKPKEEYSEDAINSDDFLIIGQDLNPLSDSIAHQSEEEIIDEIINITHNSSYVHIINKAFAIVFLVVTMFFCVGNFAAHAINSLIASFQTTTEKTITHDPAYPIAEATTINNYNNKTLFKNNFKSFLGYIKSFSGGNFKFDNVTNDIYKDRTNRLTYVCQYQNALPLAMNIMDLNNFVTECNGKFMYVQAPFKILKDESKYGYESPLFYSIKDFSNENADEIVSALALNSVATYDLRNILVENDRVLAPLFFYTDSRWTIDTAFKAYTNTMETLINTQGADRSNYKLFSGYDNFIYNVTEGVFSGNQSSVMGDGYLKFKDNFDYFVPYARTAFSTTALRSDGTIVSKEGDFTKSILSKTTESSSLFETYLGPTSPKIEINNNLSSSGEKLLILGDDFVNPFASFMALNFRKTIVINPSLYKGSIKDLIQAEAPDYVITLYNPQSFSNMEYFNFDS